MKSVRHVKSVHRSQSGEIGRVPRFIQNPNHNEWEKRGYIGCEKSLHHDPWRPLVYFVVRKVIYHPIACNSSRIRKTHFHFVKDRKNGFRIWWLCSKSIQQKKIDRDLKEKKKREMERPEEEPLEKSVAFHAGEEERLSRSIGSWVIQHRQLSLYVFHLPCCHFPQHTHSLPFLSQFICIFFEFWG